MLSDKEKKEMLADGLSQKRRQNFLAAEKKKLKIVQSLDDYMAFLMDVQKIKPFKHSRVITSAGKNIL